MYEEHEIQTKCQKNNASVCLTTDCWTSVNTESLTATTASLVNENFNSIPELLQCTGMKRQHTSQNLANASYWQVKDKAVLTVSDNA
jgi:hypothetical protein